MRILHVVRGLRNSSGTTHIVGPLAEAQAQLGADVSLYSVEQGGETPVAPNQTLVRSQTFPASISLPAPNHAGISFPFASALRRAIETFDFVHIHAIWNFPTWYTMRTASRAGVPYMVAPQGSLEPWALKQNAWGKRLYGSLMEKPLLKRAASIQAVSATESAQISDFGLKVPTFVIPNGVNGGLLRRKAPRLAAELGFGAKQKTLLYLSRLHPKKGPDILIKGLARSARQDVILVIAGHDAGSGYETLLRRMVAETGIGSRCVFLGELKGEAKFIALLGADAFALPSRSEGLPVAAIEAMAAGLPIIISPGCNLPEVGSRSAGLIIQPDSEAVAGAIDHLFADDARRKHMGANGRALVEERLTWPKIASQLLALYQELASLQLRPN